MLGGNGQTGTSGTEEDYFRSLGPVDQLKLKRELANKRTYSPSEAATNLQKTLEGLAYSTPVVANAMSIRDAYEAKERAGKATDPTEKKQAEAESAMAALSAFLPFSIGKPTAGSASRFGVFVPVKEGKTAERARNMFDRVADEADPQEANRRVWRETNTFFGPEGAHLREIRDNPNMQIKGTFKAGDSAKLSDVIDHPELFDELPEYRNIPVRFINSSKDKRKYAGWDADTGELLIDDSFQGNDLRVQLAKNLQYRINQDFGRVNAARETAQSKIADAEAAISQTERLIDEGLLPEDIGRDYVKSLRDVLDEGDAVYRNPKVEPGSYAERKGFYPGSPLNKNERKGLRHKFWTDRSAGKLETKAVKQRAYAPDRAEGFPYKSSADKMQVAAVIPQQGMSDAALASFISAWKKYGLGRGRSKDR